jgi:hypothetical protein
MCLSGRERAKFVHSSKERRLFMLWFEIVAEPFLKFAAVNNT